MSAIVYCLQQRAYTIERLHSKVNHILSDNFSKSSIEKDIGLQIGGEAETRT